MGPASPGWAIMRKQRPGSGDIRANSRWTRDKKRADGHASDLPERTSRHPSLHLTAPYAIPPLSCGNTLQSGAARGVASWPNPRDRRRLRSAPDPLGKPARPGHQRPRPDRCHLTPAGTPPAPALALDPGMGVAVGRSDRTAGHRHDLTTPSIPDTRRGTRSGKAGQTGDSPLPASTSASISG